MTITPSDLPPEARRAMLDRLRSQIGESQYRELTDRADEDQILEVMLRQAGSQPAGQTRPSPPAWAVVVGKLVLAAGLGGLAWLVGVESRAGRALAGAAAGVLFSFAFDVPGFAFGGVIGGALGGAFGKKLDAAMAGVFIGGWSVVLIRIAVEWLAKKAAEITRYTRY